MMPSTTQSHTVPYWRLSSFYFCYFAVVGALTPYWGVYLKSFGYNSKDVGIISAIILATRIIAPNFWGWLADKTQQRLRIIRIGSAIALVTFAAVLMSHQYAWLVLVISFYTFFWHAVLPQFEVITLSHLSGQHQRYAQIRLWGSVGFIAAVVGLGWLFDVISIRFLPIFILSFLLLIWLSSFAIREQMMTKHTEQSHGFFKIVSQTAMISFLMASFLLQFSHGSYYTFYSLYLTENYGYSSTSTGLLWALGVLAEITSFLVIPKIMHRVDVRSLLLVSFLVTAFRWLLIGYAASSLPTLIFAQLLHAFSFGVAHAASIEIVRTRFKGGHQGQGQALYSSFSFGAGGAAGALIGAFVWDFSASLTYFISSVAVFLGFIILFFGLHFKMSTQTTPCE